MAINKCYRCDRLYPAENWPDNCPYCGSNGREVDNYEFLKCYRCDTIYPAESWSDNCPRCGSNGRQL